MSEVSSTSNMSIKSDPQRSQWLIPDGEGRGLKDGTLPLSSQLTEVPSQAESIGSGVWTVDSFQGNNKPVASKNSPSLLLGGNGVTIRGRKGSLATNIGRHMANQAAIGFESAGVVGAVVGAVCGLVINGLFEELPYAIYQGGRAVLGRIAQGSDYKPISYAGISDTAYDTLRCMGDRHKARITLMQKKWESSFCAEWGDDSDFDEQAFTLTWWGEKGKYTSAPVDWGVREVNWMAGWKHRAKFSSKSAFFRDWEANLGYFVSSCQQHLGNTAALLFCPIARGTYYGAQIGYFFTPLLGNILGEKLGATIGAILGLAVGVTLAALHTVWGFLKLVGHVVGVVCYFLYQLGLWAKSHFCFC